MTEGGFDTTGLQDGYLNNHMLPQDDAAYLELNDLIAPLDFCPEVHATEEISIGNLFLPFSPGNMDCVRYRGDFSGMNWYASGPLVKEMDQKFQVSEKTKSAFTAAEQTVSNTGSTIMKNRNW
ncbi:binding partner of ACD11 1-like [Abeliophyllum distichum]|uniref:Binding partner of ACD11 1-like n=1 Tax=Abeliophyllum distichum TaxID=126358 RepID=A0ABD1VWJ5_9LAMI